jgi:ribonuclease P protein component
VIESVTRASDFTKVLNAPCRARSIHFALHNLAQAPQAWSPTNKPDKPPRGESPEVKLSTGLVPVGVQPVDETIAGRRWLGLVVPKRHARRAVTRTLIKRHIRAAMQQALGLDGGMWVVRLRLPFAKTEFSSAASDHLAQAASTELATLMAAAAAPVRRRP